ncbi:unnamed protein product, partial [Porites evermanni]
DIDECSINSHSCDVNAVCSNTVGLYVCACKAGYSGDGNTCTGEHKCQNYTTLDNANRKITYHGHKLHCDNTIGPGWFRFEGAAGKMMPTSCPPKFRCGTTSTGWLNGEHPTVEDGQVTRMVCFHWMSKCCKYLTYIKVRNCGSYYVYYLSGTPLPRCYLRYCGTDHD